MGERADWERVTPATGGNSGVRRSCSPPVGYRGRRGGRTVAIAVVTVAVLAGSQCRSVTRDGPQPKGNRLEELVAAVGSTRLTAGRLTGGFQYGPESAVRGAAGRVSPAVTIAAARIEESLEADSNPQTLNAAGTAYLLTGRIDGAIDHFLEGTAEDSTNAGIWSNLAAAYIEKARPRTTTSVEPLVRAIDAGERAVSLSPSLPEAWFNLALARELIQTRDARLAWQRYMTLETVPAWQTEAAAHLKGPRPADAGGWDVSRAILDDDAAADSAVTKACTQFPGETRVYIEEVLLARWAAAAEHHDAANAGQVRRRIARLAGCLRTRTTDRFLEDVAGGIPSAIGGPDALRQASAYRRFQKGRQLVEQARETEAAREFDGARAMVRAGTPFASLIVLQQATLDYQRRRLKPARAALDTVIREAQRHGYRSVEARARIMLGSVLMQGGQLHEAADEYAQGAALVDPLGEPDLSTTALYSLANTARLVGNSHVGWSAVARAMAQLDRITNARRRYMVLYNASMLAEHDGLLHAAKYFQDGALDVALQRGVAGAIAEAYTRRAALEDALGWKDPAAHDLASAESTLKSVTDPLRADYYRALIDATRGVQTTSTDPAAAQADLTRAIRFFSTVEPADVPRLFLQRGRTNLRLSQTGPARDDFGAGIAALERLRARTSDRADRISLFDSAWQLFGEMVALHVQEPDVAFEFAERGRARTLADANLGGEPRLLEPSQIVDRLDEHSVILQYATLPNQTLLWLLRRSGTRLFKIPAGAQEIGAMVGRYVAAIRRDPAAADESLQAQRLHELLLGSARDCLTPGDRLVIVGDGPLLALPFAALVRPQSGHRLIEDFAIVTAPSSNLFLWSAAATSPRELPRGRVLTVGNPAFNRAAYPDLRDLPGAEREAVQIGGMFPGARILTGAAATKDRFLQELEAADIVHIASHAVVNEDFPMDSELLFAEGGGASSLSIGELGRVHASGPRLVVLAACGTARGPVYRLEGVMSLARAFMEIGAPQVVATLWDVDDASAGRVFDGFYSGLIRGSSPVDALRAAQLALVTGDDPRLRSPRHWAPYVLFGGERTFIRR